MANQNTSKLLLKWLWPSRYEEAISFAQLRSYNLIACLLHALQGVIVLIISNPTSGIKPITVNYLTLDRASSAVAGHQVMASATRHLFDLNLAYLIAAFFFISALAHLSVATFYRRRYEKDLRRGVNRYRWIEYSFSISIMVVAVAILTGVYDLPSLLMVFALTSVMSLMGLLTEYRNENMRRVDWFAYIVGVGAGAVPWLVMLIYIWSAHAYGSGVPTFVYWVFGSLLVLFYSFAANLYLQLKHLGRWSTYLFGERAYIILSFVAKTILAWQVFAVTLH
jgi:hypothetical protein